ncbi:two pore domain potassium channel family protein [Vibrio sp. 1151_11]|uniref:potassium channel family protein n=1 Tax=Vibrio sp. 1151_11 TaxID=2527670 RepID=UPI002406F04A|nr:potassium channel family protein [Vibrio sp. 1151_11]MDF9390552.1 two pore domain potassium channel family protein [Vibrio sp. 1151_11]
MSEINFDVLVERVRETTNNKWFWGIAYLSLIPIFSVIYFLLPNGSFYHASSMHENNFYEHKLLLTKEFHENLINSLNQSNGSTIIENDGWASDVAKLGLFQLEVSDAFEATIQFQMLSEKAIDGTKLYDLRFVSVKFPVGGGSVGEMAVRPLTVEGYEGHPIPINKLFPQTDDLLLFAFNQSDNRPHIGLKSEFIGSLFVLCGAQNGFPNELPGQFSRMLYLSIVTITTLGYGDIVPLTGTARFWVGLQSILGILVIGLFLNALTSQRKKSCQISPETKA